MYRWQTKTERARERQRNLCPHGAHTLKKFEKISKLYRILENDVSDMNKNKAE